MVEHDHVFKPEQADRLVSEERQEEFPAENIVSLMNIQQGDIVADFGAGNGYFTIPIAKTTKEKIYAIDAEPKMLDLLKERAEKAGLHTIERVHAGVDDTPIAAAAVDKVLISRTIHHAPSVAGALQEMKRILQPEGSLYIIEFYKDSTHDGPPLEMRISPDEMTEALDKAGFSAQVTQLTEAEYAVEAQKQN